jgi:hypothetical protein
MAMALAQSEQSLAAVGAFMTGALAQIVIDKVMLRRRPAGDDMAARAAHALSAIPLDRRSPTTIDLATVGRVASIVNRAVFLTFGKVLGSATVLLVPAVLTVGTGIEAVAPWVIAPAILGFATPTLLSPARWGLPAFAGAAGLTADHTERMLTAARVPKGSVAPLIPEVEPFAVEERADVMHWLWALRIGRQTPLRTWLPPRDYGFISYAWAGEAKSGIAERVAASCGKAGIAHFVDTQGVESPSGLYRFFLARGIARATHVLLVVTPELLQGTVVLREIETAMLRWPLERSPAIICVVEPGVAETLRTDRAAPLSLRFLLSFCPQLSVEEASAPDIVRYVLAWTRRPAKLDDWLFLLSPATALSRAVSLDGVVDEALAGDGRPPP